MQTFLPFPDFKKSAQCLDTTRLGKQRVETLQILNALLLPDKGWKNHPATRMWRGHEYQLAEYGKAIALEWVARGHCDTCYDKICRMQELVADTGLPIWFGNEELHESHRSNLMRKSTFYHFNNTRENLEYVWPV